MEFAMRSFAVVSLLLLVSLSTDMVDARCNLNLCQRYCALQGKPGCCSGLAGPCLCQSACPRTSAPLEVDTGRKCNWTLCRKYCSLLGKPACCPGPSGPCRCTGICPRFETKEIAEEIMVDAADEELIIKETVTA